VIELMAQLDAEEAAMNAEPSPLATGVPPAPTSTDPSAAGKPSWEIPEPLPPGSDNGANGSAPSSGESQTASAATPPTTAPEQKSGSSTLP
jgi:hypothetical protein